MSKPVTPTDAKDVGMRKSEALFAAAHGYAPVLRCRIFGHVWTRRIDVETEWDEATRQVVETWNDEDLTHCLKCGAPNPMKAHTNDSATSG